MNEAGPFSVRVIAAIVAAGILAFGAFLWLAAYAGDFRTGLDGRGHALSVSGVGFAGLVELVDATGGTGAIVRSEAGTDSEDLLVVTLEPDSDLGKLNALLVRRTDKPTLLILPKWMTFPDRGHPGWVKRVALLEGKEAAHPIARLAPFDLVHARLGTGRIAEGADLLAGLSVPAPRVAQGLRGRNFRPLLAAPEGGALLVQVEGRPLYVLADPDLANDHGLKDPETAKAALAILAALNSTGARTVAFDVTMNGFGRSPSPLKLIFEPPFLALSLALFVAALLAGLHGAFRFGPARREERAIAYGKSALVENSAALVRMARREHRAGLAYAELIRDAAARDAAAPASLRDVALAAYLDRISPGTSFSALATRIRQASSRTEMLAAARALFQWKKEISQ